MLVSGLRAAQVSCVRTRNLLLDMVSLEGYKFKLLNNKPEVTGLSPKAARSVRSAILDHLLAASLSFPRSGAPLAARLCRPGGLLGLPCWAECEKANGWARYRVLKVTECTIVARLENWESW